jgi:hypothetical protein
MCLMHLGGQTVAQEKKFTPKRQVECKNGDGGRLKMSFSRVRGYS